MNSNDKSETVVRRSVQPDCYALAEYKTWLHGADQKWRRRSPYSFKWKLWGQMPLLAFKIGWMACEACHRLKAKAHNTEVRRADQ